MYGYYPISPTDAKQEAKEATESIKKIIGPNDLIHQDIDTWENADIELLRTELAESAGNMLAEEQQPYESLCHELAISLWIKEMPRLSIEHLAYESKEDAVINAHVWPYQMNKWEIEEIVRENWANEEMIHEYHEYRNVAYDYIFDGILDGFLKDFE